MSLFWDAILLVACSGQHKHTYRIVELPMFPFLCFYYYDAESDLYNLSDACPKVVASASANNLPLKRNGGANIPSLAALMG